MKVMAMMLAPRRIARRCRRRKLSFGGVVALSSAAALSATAAAGAASGSSAAPSAAGARRKRRRFGGFATSAGAGELTAASIGACHTSNGFSSPATALDLGGVSDRSGQISYDPVQGGRDGVIAIGGDLRITLKGQVLGLTVTGIYGFRTGGADGLTFDVYNRDNPNRPLPDDDLQGKSDAIQLVRESGSSSVCPSSGTGSGAAIGRGESTPGSGVFDRKLYLTS